jgi:hypothetical protein
MSFAPYHDVDLKGADDYENELLLPHHVANHLKQRQSKRARVKKIAKTLLLLGATIALMCFVAHKSLRFGGRKMVRVVF